MVGRIPDTIIQRPKKGFSVPWKVWRAQIRDWAGEELRDGAAVQAGLLAPDPAGKVGTERAGARDCGPSSCSSAGAVSTSEDGMTLTTSPVRALRILAVPAKPWPCDHAMLESVFAQILPARGHRVEWVMWADPPITSPATWHGSTVHLTRYGAARRWRPQVGGSA